MEIQIAAQSPPDPLASERALSRELDVIFSQAVKADNWLDTNPDLHIQATSAGWTVAPREVDEGEIAASLADLRGDGYLQVSDFLSRADAARLADGLTRVQQVGWLPIFAFVYDEFWHATARLSRVLSAILGAEYRQLPDFWAWYIKPSDQERGWGPHRDRPGTIRPDGLPETLTVWIALTPATPLNGCIYIVPAGRDARYGSAEAQDLRKADLQNIRALPAEPGSLFMWNQGVYHWGGRSSTRATAPRISFACEFQRGDRAPVNAPLLDPHTPPDFRTRLKLIGKQIRQYQHMYNVPPLLSRFAGMLAE